MSPMKISLVFLLLLNCSFLIFPATAILNDGLIVKGTVTNLSIDNIIFNDHKNGIEKSVLIGDVMFFSNTSLTKINQQLLDCKFYMKDGIIKNGMLLFFNSDFFFIYDSSFEKKLVIDNEEVSSIDYTFVQEDEFEYIKTHISPNELETSVLLMNILNMDSQESIDISKENFYTVFWNLFKNEYDNYQKKIIWNLLNSSIKKEKSFIELTHEVSIDMDYEDFIVINRDFFLKRVLKIISFSNFN